MKLLKKLAIIIPIVFQASCSEIPKEAYADQWKTEGLLDVTTETVNIDLNRRNAMAQLSNIVTSNEPANAVLYCANMQMCNRAGSFLQNYGISYEVRSAETNVASLNFERVIARDCENRFIDNHTNPYNLNHPTFGCASALNSVQMVRDKRQFTDPLILGPYDGFKASQNYDSYLAREFEGRVIEVRQESATGN